MIYENEYDVRGYGLPVYEGLQYQRGHGFFGSLFTNIIKPLGKYLGKHLLSTGVKVGKEVLSGEDLKTSLKKNFKETTSNVLDEGYGHLKKQAGFGKRRMRRRKKKVIKSNRQNRISSLYKGNSRKKVEFPRRKKKRTIKLNNFKKIFE